MFCKRHKAITQHTTKAAQRFWKTNSGEKASRRCCVLCVGNVAQARDQQQDQQETLNLFVGVLQTAQSITQHTTKAAQRFWKTNKGEKPSHNTQQRPLKDFGRPTATKKATKF